MPAKEKKVRIAAFVVGLLGILFSLYMMLVSSSSMLWGLIGLFPGMLVFGSLVYRREIPNLCHCEISNQGTDSIPDRG